MSFRLFYSALLLVVFVNFAFSQYISYDGVNILFGNDSQLSVFTCGSEKCYPGFANINLNSSKISLSAQPLSDDFVNISVDFDVNSSESCILRFINQKPLRGAPSQDSSVVLFYNQDVSFAIISTNPDTTPFFLDISEGQVCVGATKNEGKLNFLLASPLWVNSNLELVEETTDLPLSAKNESETSTLPLTGNENNSPSIKPEYIAAASAAVFLIAVFFTLFMKKKKPTKDLTPLITKSDNVADLGPQLVDERKVAEAQKVLDELLDD